MTPSHFYLLFEKDMAFILNNLEFPLPKDNLYQVWMKLATGSEEDFKKISMYFYYFAIISPWKGAIPFF